MTNDEYFNEIETYFIKLREYREESKRIAAGIVGENFTEDDLFFISALNRRVQFIDGIIDLLRTRNLTCAGILVRTQLEIEEIYNKSSGYVHLSEVAFHQAFWTECCEKGDKIKFSVGLSPREKLNPTLIECAEVFCHFTEIEYDFYQKIINSKKDFDNKQKDILELM